MKHDKNERDFFDRVQSYFFKREGTAPDGSPVYTPIMKRVGGAIIAGLALLMFVTGFFIVSPTQQAVILRLGAYTETLNPGPHWIPPFLYSRKLVNIQQIYSLPYRSLMLTKDENIVSVAVAVQYRIGNPRDFLYNVVGPTNTLIQATSSALRQMVGKMTLNEILTVGREELRNNIDHQLKTIIKPYHLGINIADVLLQATKPPRDVIAAFNDAVKAREDSQRYINKAKAVSKRILLETKGNVAKITEKAKAYYKTVTLEAQGRVGRYNAYLKAYNNEKQITQTRLYLDAMSSILSGTTNVVVANSSQNLMYLPIDKLIKNGLQNNQVKSQGRNSNDK